MAENETLRHLQPGILPTQLLPQASVPVTMASKALAHLASPTGVLRGSTNGA
jgi:hypothetical protein